MLNKISSLAIFVMLYGIFSATCLNAQGTGSSEILTLFTTQQERLLIDNNRYREVSSRPISSPVIVEQSDQMDDGKTIYNEVTINLLVTGITLSDSGQNIAWVNGQAMEDGSELEDGSKVLIKSKSSTFIQIATPDGKYHRVQAGEEADIKYLVAVKEQ